MCSVEKWLDTGRWKEIVDEGEKSSEMTKDQIRLLHIPSTLPVGPTKPEPPPGFERRKFDPKTGGKIFDELLKTSTMIFENVAKAGKNLTSMKTPITVLSEGHEVDIKEAAINGFDLNEINGQVLV